MTSGPATVTYFLGQSLVGSRESYCCGYSEAGESYSAYWPNIAYFCEICGELWGRQILTFHFDYAPRFGATWKVRSRPCQWCGGGNFLVDEPLDGADEALLRHELRVLITQHEKGTV